MHLPYIVALALAYERGEFSVAYPLARGGGALLAGIGGIILLGDELNGWSVAAIVIVTTGMALLAFGASRPQVMVALFVAVTIGCYTVIDSHASREVDDNTYALAIFVDGGLFVTAYGVVVGRGREMAGALVDAVATVPGHGGDEHVDVRARAGGRAASARRLRRRAA